MNFHKAMYFKKIGFGFRLWVPVLVITPLISGCDLMHKVESKAQKIVVYEKAALNLSKENRELKAKLGALEFEIAELEEKNNYLTIKMGELSGKLEADGERAPASVNTNAVILEVKEDLVKDAVFNWDPAQLLSVAETELKKRNFEKSAQFYRTLIKKYPSSTSINDQVLLQAAIAAYETGHYHKWTQDYLADLLDKYPTSAFYRAAKLYQALSFLKLGKNEDFYKIVEEFRLKYRNTPEWKIVSAHYEEFLKRYK